MINVTDRLKIQSVLIACSLALVACDQNVSGNDQQQAPTAIFGPPTAVGNLVQSRMIDQNVLFAEVVLRYGTTEEMVTVSRQQGPNGWEANFRIPSGNAYSLEITWYDTADVDRVNLVNLTRNFAAVFESGPLSFQFSDYDFDGYDDDSDGMTNLAERQAGSSPINAENNQTAAQTQCPVLPEANANAENRNPLTGEVGENYIHTVQNTDTFDLALPQINVFFDSLSSPTDGLSAEADGSLKISVTSADEFSSIQLRPVNQDSEFLRARLMYVGGESTQPFVDAENRDFDSRVQLVGDFFNILSDFGNGTNEGNGRLDLNLRNFADGGFSRVLLCAQILAADGSRRDFVAGTEDGDNDGCAANQDFGSDYNNDQQYLLGIGIDRQLNSVFFQRDNNTVQMPTTEQFFRPSGELLALQASASGADSRSTVIVSEISSQEGISNNLSSLATRPAYRNLGVFRFDDNRDVQVEDGRLKMTTVADGTNGNSRTALRLSGFTDYLSADLALSSETSLLDSSGGVLLAGRYYNDLSNFGRNGSEGDHVGTVGVMTNSAGEVFGQACLTRSQSAGFDQSCELLGTSDSNCQRFPSPLNIDTTYSASIELDRATRQMIFVLDGQRIEHNLTTNLFLPNSGDKQAQTAVFGTGTVIGFVDNLSTNKLDVQ